MRKQLVYLDFCTGQIVCHCLLVKQYAIEVSSAGDIDLVRYLVV